MKEAARLIIVTALCEHLIDASPPTPNRRARSLKLLPQAQVCVFVSVPMACFSLLPGAALLDFCSQQVPIQAAQIDAKIINMWAGDIDIKTGCLREHSSKRHFVNLMFLTCMFCTPHQCLFNISCLFTCSLMRGGKLKLF